MRFDIVDFHRCFGRLLDGQQMSVKAIMEEAEVDPELWVQGAVSSRVFAKTQVVSPQLAAMVPFTVL